MTIQVLAIGDTGNMMMTLSKYTKKSRIHIINFPRDGAGIYTYLNGYELFENYKVSDQVKKINKIKDKFDICITMGTGERIAYLADLNYIAYYVGRDIDAPRFIKNSKEMWSNEPLHTLNFLERKFYRNTFDNAIAHVAYTWVFRHLKKYTENAIRMDRIALDSTIFNIAVKPLDRRKTKFTFFSPQRVEKFKGTDLLWKALSYCKSDFEILQVNLFGETNEEEKRFKENLLKNRPQQVTLISPVKIYDMPKYYKFVDGVIGNMWLGIYELVALESVLCKTPVIQYTNPEMKIIIDGKEMKSPFVPTSNDPKKIAELIDKVVESKEFRETLLEKEYEFVKEISDPYKFGEWWDSLFEDLVKKHKSIKRNSSPIIIKFRIMFFLLANRLYFKKIVKQIINLIKLAHIRRLENNSC